MSIYGKGAKGKATRLHAELVRARGTCESCGSRDNLQCAHIVSRRYSATRTDLANAFCLCAGCHMRFTEWPMDFAAFVVEKIGVAGYDALKDKAESNPRPWRESDWKTEADRLAAL